VLALLLVAAAEPQQKNVRPKATVEVLDSTAEVDDVISKLRTQKPESKKELKDDRPPLPPDATPEKGKPGKNEKSSKEKKRDHRPDRDRLRHH
jgi:hypothetical protein